MKKRLDFKKGLLWLGRIILFPLIAFEAIIIVMIIREAALYVFYPIPAPLSVTVTDFQEIDLEYVPWIDSCKGKSDITQRSSFNDLSVNINNPDSYETIYFQTYSSSNADQRFIADFGVIDGDLIITKYIKDGSPVVADIKLKDQQGKRFQFTTTRVDATPPKRLLASQSLCSNAITINKFGNSYDMSFGITGIFSNYSAARISMDVDDGDGLTVTFLDVIFSDDPHTMVDKVEIKFTARGESSVAFLGVEGNHLSSGLLSISPYYDKEQEKMVIANGNSIESFFLEGIKIVSPKGSAQFGSYKKLEFYESLVEYTGETFVASSIPIRLATSETGGLSLNTNLLDGEINFSGVTPTIEYRKQKFGISRWEQLPGYIQTGVFGLLLGVLPTWWGIIRNRASKKSKEDLKNDFQPLEGSFICVLDSGYMITGQLVKGPGFWSPYYIIREAHRKRISEKNWESEIIPLINIKSSRVEQYYFKGK